MAKRSNLAASLKAAAGGEAPSASRQIANLTQTVLPPPAMAKGGRAPSRSGRKAVYAWVDPAMHKRLKLLSLESGQSIDALVTQAVATFLDARK